MSSENQTKKGSQKTPTIEELRKAKVHSPVFKLFTASFLLLGLVGAFGPLIDSDAYEGRLYTDIIFAVLPWWGWSIIWLTLVIFIMMHLIWSKYLAFFITNIIVIFISTAYAIMVLYAKFVLELPLSGVAFAVWISLTFMALAAIRADVTISGAKGKSK